MGISITDAYELSFVSVMRMFSYAAITIAFMVDYVKEDHPRIGKRLVFTIFLIALLAYYKDIITAGDSMFTDAVEESRGYITSTCRTLAKANPENVNLILQAICDFCLQTLLTVSRIMQILSGFVKTFIQSMLISIAPIIIGVSAWKIFNNVFTHFIVVSLWICMWNVAFCIADIMIARIIRTAVGGEYAVPGAAGLLAGGAAAAYATAAWPVLLYMASLVAGAMLLLYIIAPIFLYRLLTGGAVSTLIAESGNLFSGSTRSIGAAAKPVAGAASAGMGAASKVLGAVRGLTAATLGNSATGNSSAGHKLSNFK